MGLHLQHNNINKSRVKFVFKFVTFFKYSLSIQNERYIEKKKKAWVISKNLWYVFLYLKYILKNMVNSKGVSDNTHLNIVVRKKKL